MADGTAYSPADKAGKTGGTSGQQLRTLAEIREAIAKTTVSVSTPIPLTKSAGPSRRQPWPCGL